MTRTAVALLIIATSMAAVLAVAWHQTTSIPRVSQPSAGRLRHAVDQLNRTVRQAYPHLDDHQGQDWWTAVVREHARPIDHEAIATLQTTLDACDNHRERGRPLDEAISDDFSWAFDLEAIHPPATSTEGLTLARQVRRALLAEGIPFTIDDEHIHNLDPFNGFHSNGGNSLFAMWLSAGSAAIDAWHYPQHRQQALRDLDLLMDRSARGQRALNICISQAVRIRRDSTYLGLVALGHHDLNQVKQWMQEPHPDPIRLALASATHEITTGLIPYLNEISSNTESLADLHKDWTAMLYDASRNKVLANDAPPLRLMSLQPLNAFADKTTTDIHTIIRNLEKWRLSSYVYIDYTDSPLIDGYTITKPHFYDPGMTATSLICSQISHHLYRWAARVIIASRAGESIPPPPPGLPTLVIRETQREKIWFTVESSDTFQQHYFAPAPQLVIPKALLNQALSITPKPVPRPGERRRRRSAESSN